MEARNRNLGDWYGKIKRSEIRLPRFQRFEAWDRHRIVSLLETVIHNLPLGITLVLEVGEKEQFVSRVIETAPDNKTRALEHLLDGQQRLTALWRTFHNNYDSETYYIYVKEFDQLGNEEIDDDLAVSYKGRYKKKNGLRYPLWCDDPAQCLRKGLIPTHLLKPEDIQTEIDDWLALAIPEPGRESDLDEFKNYFKYRQQVSDKIKDIRSVVANYNLPYLSLPAHTDKNVALSVFINMNTNSKPLSTYDIIVAEVEDVMGESLHDLQDKLDAEYPDIAKYSELPDIILTTSALLQGHLPNQRGAWDMDKRVMIEIWNVMKNGMGRMTEFLRDQGIYDSQRLPTNAVLAVISALYAEIPDSGDKRGSDELILKRYLWYSFFTDRYENSAASRAYADYIALRRVLRGETKENNIKYSLDDVPIFKEHELAEVEELLTADWPKRKTIRGRAILAVTCQLGAMDFSTGELINANNIERRHYHHIYPDALLKEAGINSFLALNCALISDKTNMKIGRKDPLEYMKDRFQWTSSRIVNERLQSHMIPIEELANGGYEGLSAEQKAEKLKEDFDKFIRRRAEIVINAVRLLAEGRQLSISEVYKEA